MIDFDPPEPPPTTMRSLSPCTSEILSKGMPSCWLKTCANGVAWPMPKSSVPVVSVTVPSALNDDAGGFLGRPRGDFKIIADAEPAQLAALAALAFAARETFAVGKFKRLLGQRGEVAAVISRGGRRLIRKFAAG